ncbi:MAG: hypothetical protein ABWZ88_08045 [Variovorax sp.]
MATAMGLGFFIVVLQALLLAGALNRVPVLLLVAAGVVLAALRYPGWRRQPAVQADAPTAAERVALIGLLLVGLPTLSAPLAPPVAYDEVMYHLPYARQLAEGGRMAVYEWLRYPWFPYNYDLLYAAALQIYDDVFTHLLHAMAGWLSVLMIYRLGLQHINRLVACIGAGIWLALGDYPNSYIDMGVALFILCGFTMLWWWREGQPHDAGVRWLALGAFFLGVAAGSKYQALIFLPLVAVFVLRRERRPWVWGIALVCFLLPCVYWYARNAVMTGDPFNPIGARIFGFTNWNEADYKQQIVDVQLHHANPPNVLFWPVLLAPFSLACRRSSAVRAALIFCGWSLLVWVVTSRYPRYLVPSYPLLALMAAVGWHQLFVWIGAAWRSRHPQPAAGATPQATSRWPGVASRLLVAAMVVASVLHSVQNIRVISPTEAEREEFFRARVPGYDVLTWLRRNPVEGRLYQVILNDALYFAPNPVWGDVFGPWRYADFLGLPAEQMARKLRDHHFGSIVIQTKLAPNIDNLPDFDRYFRLLTEKDGVKAYRILPTAP